MSEVCCNAVCWFKVEVMSITEYALNNRALMKFFIAVLVGGGIFAFLSMSKLEDPEIKVKQAMVVTVYPGASAHKVELEVTDVLERSIRSMGEIDNIQSKSLADVSQITVEMKSTVAPDELEQVWDMLRRKVANAQAGLPEGARPSLVMDDFGDVYGMFYAMTTDGIPDEELMDYARLVKRELQDVEGVRRVEIYGDRKPCINIEIIQDKMANLGVHPLEVLSHEIRTPLNAIVGFSSLLTETEDMKDRKQYMAIVQENTELLLQLISDILDLSKMESGAFEFVKSDTDVNLLCGEIIRSLRMKVPAGVELVFEKCLPECHVWADKNRLNQVISNFINNALKFTFSGSITLGYYRQTDGYLRFYVRDTGMGIPRNKIKTVFDRFVKLNSFVHGTGLGLSICKSLVEQMGGTIGVESEEGEGSCFWFTYPYQDIVGSILPP